MQNFSYYTPSTIEEAIALMADDPAHSRYLAGGTDIFLALEHAPQNVPPVHRVIDLKAISGMAGISGTAGEGFRIGALTPMREIEQHQTLGAALPALRAAAAVVGGPNIRNRATLGGNLVNASPAADTATPLLALNARLTIVGTGEVREIPIHELCSAPRRTTLAAGEVLKDILIPPLPAHSGNAFTRITRTAMDIALVNAAAAVALDDGGNLVSLRLALGAVGPTVLLAEPVEDALRGKPLDDAAWAEVGRLAEAAARPIGDVRAGAEYRAEMAGVLASRAVRQAAAMARGEKS